MRRSAIAIALGSSTLVAALGTPAYANGRFPNADHLVVDPSDPDHVIVRATFGIVQTFDGGTTWVWLCEPAVGYGGTDDPAIAATGAGNLLVGIRTGIATSSDGGCAWETDETALAGFRIVDLAIDAQSPSSAVAITADDVDGNPRVVVGETVDDGGSWAKLGQDLGSDLVPQTIDAAPSSPDRLYVSAVAGVRNVPVIERSSDRGETWTRLDVDIPDAERTVISAVSPLNPDVVYLRVPGEGTDRLFVSTDAAESWTEILALEGEMLGFALSPDGSKVAIGLKQGGIHVASTDDHVFSQVGQSGVRCLSWAEAGLYACGNEGQDGFTVGRSTDEGASFTPLYHLLDIGLLECAAGTDAGDQCPALFQDLLDQLGNTGGAGGEPTGTTSGTSAATSGGGTSPDDGDDGCSCNVGGGSSSAAFLLGVAALGLLVRSRRKT